MKRFLVLLATMVTGVLLASGVALAASTVVTKTSTNSDGISILSPPDASPPTAANPYPSAISVSGFNAGSSILDVNLKLLGFTHPAPKDVDIILQHGDQSAIVMSDVGCFSVVDLGLTLDDEAANAVPDDCGAPLTSGSYQPIDYENPGEDATFPSPANTLPTDGSALSVFDGTDPNGTWNLFVVDDAAGNAGQLAGGWSLEMTANSPDTTAPTAKAPKHRFTTLSTLATTTVPVKLTWSATDNTGGSGIASYLLQQSVNGGAYTNVALPSATATTISRSLAPGTNTYRYRVAAKDNAGNLSGWATGPSFKVRAFQESSSAIVDTGSWITSALSGAYGGSVQSASALGRNATFTAPAGSKNVEWVSYRGNRGKAQVWLDGVQQDAKPSVTGIQPFDLYSSSVQARKVVFSKAVSPTTSHKLEVRVLGQKNGSSTSTRVDIDAFVTTS